MSVVSLGRDKMRLYVMEHYLIWNITCTGVQQMGLYTVEVTRERPTVLVSEFNNNTRTRGESCGRH